MYLRYAVNTACAALHRNDEVHCTVCIYGTGGKDYAKNIQIKAIKNAAPS